MTIFEAPTHLSYLEHWLKSQPKQGYGLKSQIAKVIGTQTGFITQVFQELAQFSMEQGILITQWMGLNGDETQFFLLLLQRDRAGNSELKKHLEHQIESFREKREDLAERLKAKKAPTEVDQSIYFSSWLYSYVHVLLTCKEHTTLGEIAEALGQDPSEVKPIIDFLVGAKLADSSPKGYSTGEARMHIGTNSPHLLKHHLNWNLKALYAIERDLKKGVHYSSVVSLSEEDYLRAKDLWVNTLAEFKEIVKDSQGEKVYGLTLNLFE